MESRHKEEERKRRQEQQQQFDEQLKQLNVFLVELLAKGVIRPTHRWKDVQQLPEVQSLNCFRKAESMLLLSSRTSASIAVVAAAAAYSSVAGNSAGICS